MAEVLILIFTAVLMGMRCVHGFGVYRGTERPFYRIWEEKGLFLTAAVFVVLYLGIWYAAGKDMTGIRLLDLAASYLVLACIDGKQKIVPDFILICMFAGQMLLGVSVQPLSTLWHMVWTGCVFGAAVGVMVSLSRGKAGMGDALLLWVTAMTAGWNYTLSLLFIGLFLSFLFSIGMLLFRRGTLKTELPFVPFLTAGLLIQMIAWF